MMRPSQIESKFVKAVRAHLYDHFDPKDPTSVDPDGILVNKLVRAIAAGFVAVLDDLKPYITGNSR